MEDPHPRQNATASPYRMSRRIAIVTTKQPGTNPRMRKNADALSVAGYDVLVLYAFTAKWADTTDESILRKAPWSYRRIGGHPIESPIQYFMTRLTRKWSNWRNNLNGIFCPSIRDFVNAVTEFNPHLTIGHNPGSLPVLCQLRSNSNLKVLFDAEDFHRGEFPEESHEAAQVARLEDACIPRLSSMTTASPLIETAYQTLYPQVHCTTINNAFDLDLQPEFKPLPTGPLKLCWFSQVVGLNRGLVEFLNQLIPLGDLDLDITIVGNATEHVRSTLQRCVSSPNHKIQFLPATSEKQLAKTVSEHHLGLALEPGFSTNNLIARSNKVFFYPLCGCLTLFSKTPGQIDFHQQNPITGHLIDLNDDKVSTQMLRNLYENRSDLELERRNAWAFAANHLNWETESKKLLELVNSLIEVP